MDEETKIETPEVASEEVIEEGSAVDCEEKVEEVTE